MTSFYQRLVDSALSVWVRDSGSIWSFPTILLLHTYGMAVLVGIILVVDLRILGFAPGLPLPPMRRFFPLVWIAFWVNAVTGTILLAADATTKMRNLDFGVKMALIAAGVVSQLMVQRRVFSDSDEVTRPVTGQIKFLSALSVMCWLGAITAGRLLAYVGGETALKGLQ